MSVNVQGQSGFTLCVGSTEDMACNTSCKPTVVRIVRGKNMSSARALFDEFAAAFAVPVLLRQQLERVR